MYAIEHNNDPWALEQSIAILERLLVENERPLPHILKNLGIAYGRVARDSVRARRKPSGRL